jgi:hypothetical protein
MYFEIFPSMFLQLIAIIREGRSALEATQVRSVLWMYID